MNNPNSGNHFNNQNNNNYGYMQPGYDMYTNNYGERTQKKNGNTMVIVLIIAAVLLFLAIIAMTAILLIKANIHKDDTTTNTQTQTQTQTQNSNQAKKKSKPSGSSTSKKSTPTYVTCVSDAQILVRSGAGKSNSVVLAINGGDTSVKLKSTGNNITASDGYVWYEVEIPSGQTAWVRSDVVTLDGPDPYQRKAVYNSASVNAGSTLVTKSQKSKIYVRSGPSKAYRIVYTIAAGDTSKELITTGSAQYDSSGYIWYQVVTPTNQLAWVRNDIVTSPGSVSYTPSSSYSSGTLVTKSYRSVIYVRSGPSKSYKIVYTIGAGDTKKELEYTGISQYGADGYIWYNVITPNNINAWVRSDIVQFK